MITLMIREGAETHMKSHEGKLTPLHFAVERLGDAVEAAMCLLEAEADKETKLYQRIGTLGAVPTIA